MMTGKKTLCALTLILALWAGMLTGCGSADETAAEAPAPDETQTVQSDSAVPAEEKTAVDAAEATPQAAGETAEIPVETDDSQEEGEPGFDAIALAEALEAVANVGPGTAGSTLRATKAAGDLVNFAARNWNESSAQAITEGIQAWWESLPGEGAEEFDLAWDMVASQARDIANTPTATETLALLADAGVELDLNALDLSHTADLLEAVSAVTGPNS